MRSNKDGKNYLNEAVEWCKENGIELFGINENPEQKDWTESPKAYGTIYIDDAALGAPLTKNANISTHAFIDWNKVEEMIFERKLEFGNTQVWKDDED